MTTSTVTASHPLITSAAFLDETSDSNAIGSRPTTPETTLNLEFASHEILNSLIKKETI